MRNHLRFGFVICCLLLLAGLRQTTFAQTVNPAYIDGELYLKLQDTTTLNLDPYLHNIPLLDLVFSAFGVDSIYRPFRSGHPALQNIYRLEFTSILGVDNLILQLQALNFVDYAEKIPLMIPIGNEMVLPNDFQASQWSLSKIHAEQAWGITLGSSNVAVAVVDNAQRVTHEDLSSVIWTNTGEIPNNFWDDDLNGYTDDVHGYDVADMDGNVNPPLTGTGWDHGSHTSGTVGAATNNGIGIASIGYGIQVIPVKASNNLAGGNTMSKAYEGVDYARAAGAQVISMSWGSTGSSVTGDLILSIASNAGIILVAAAGNNGDSIPFYPAANPRCLAVGSTDQADLRSPFSNYGSYVDVMAPGSDIYSCLGSADNAYGNLSGTSMACPLVAGLAGLMLSSNPALTGPQVVTMIIDGCENIDALNPSFAGKLGAGRINAYNSLLTTSAYTPTPASTFGIYPNPTKGILRIHAPESWSHAPIEVTAFDLVGAQKQVLQLTDLSQAVDCSTWEPGIYLLRFNQGGRMESAIVKVK